MNRTEIKTFLKKTNNHIVKNELKSALDSIRIFSNKLQNWNITDKLNELNNNYKYMLHYLIEGTKDPEQDKIYKKLIRDTYKLANDAAEVALTEESSELFFVKARISSMRSSISLNEYGEQLRKNIDNKALLSLFEEG